MIEVQYVDHMGTDLTVANALRRSYGAGFKEWSESPRSPRGRSDRQLVVDCAEDKHWLPFRHPCIEVSATSPIPIARQLGKHQVGMSWSEISRRYKTAGLTFHEFNGTWRAVDPGSRQGTGPLLPPRDQERLDALMSANIARNLTDYEEALGLAACPEQARFLLPQSMDVLWTWTGTLLAWAHLFHQRTHPDTQLETRGFAEQCGEIIRPLYPVSWAALLGESPPS